MAEIRYTKLQKIICLSCIATLCFLAIYARCKNSKSGNPYKGEESDRPARVSLREAASSQMHDRKIALNKEYALVLGFDKSDGGVGRTDTIMLVAFDHKEKQIGVISVPRDVWVDIPFIGPGRINKAYRVGEQLLGKGAGIRILSNIIEDLFSVQVSYTAAVDFEGFKWTIDALGGIFVNVECPIEDCFWIDEDKRHCERLSLAPGRRRMDGETALLYTRSRHGRTDMDRAGRQQAVLLGLWQRMTGVRTLLKLPKLWLNLKKHIDTSIDLFDVPRIVDLVKKVHIDSLHGMVLKSPAVTPSYLPDGKFILVPDKKEISSSINAVFSSPRPGARNHIRCFDKDAALNWRKHDNNWNEADAGPNDETETAPN